MASSLQNLAWVSVLCSFSGVCTAQDESIEVRSHRIESEYQAGETTIRVLLPKSFSKETRYRVLYVLPVVENDNRRFGDGLLEIKKHDLHNKHQLICVAPEFSEKPWFADHATNAKLRDESHFLKVVLPFVESTYPAMKEAKGRLLVGFSKSGWGAFSLLLRHPDKFHLAAGWDSGVRVDVGPIEETERQDRINRIWGSNENFVDYRLSNLLKKYAGKFRGSPRLFYMNTAGTKRTPGGVELHQLMSELKFSHRYVFEAQRKHRWDSGWLPEAVEFVVR